MVLDGLYSHGDRVPQIGLNIILAVVMAPVVHAFSKGACADERAYRTP